MHIHELTPEKLAGMIDHTFLKPYGTHEDIENLCAEARHYGFAMVAVNPAEVERCVALLQGCRVRVGAAIGFPLGQTTTAVKIYEIKDALQRGAGEIDMVINVRALQSGDTDLVRAEIHALADLSQGAGAISKVILETCYLTDAEKRLVCQIARTQGVDFVKTSTGFGPGGATVEDVRLMRNTIGPQMGVKAAGGIRTLQDTYAMIEAGATRIGTSSGVQIMEAMNESKQSPAKTEGVTEC